MVGCRSSHPAADAGVSRHGTTGARRHARRVDAQRARHLQPSRAADGGRRCAVAAHPGAPRADQPRHRRGRALARRTLVRLRRPAHLHGDAAKGITFSDGTPFTSADVVFSFRVLYDPGVDSVLASAVKVNGQPLQVTATDERTVQVTLPTPFAPGLALLDSVPIFSRHELEARLEAHTFRDAWGLTTPPGTMAGLGPFVVAEHVPGQRITLARNPHYWRTDDAGAALPYLDRIVMEIVSTQDAEVLRLEAGSLDLMVQADVRPEDYAALRRLGQQGTITLSDVGVGVDPNALWFNLAPPPGRHTPGYLQRAEFRQAISSAVDRDAIVKTVYLGAAIPVFGPVTPGNRVWYSGSAPTFPYNPARARSLLAGLGLVDRNGDGLLDDQSGAPVRFSILTQHGHLRERTATVIQEQLRLAGVTADVVGLDPPSIFQHWSAGDYDSIYFGFQASAMDPANNLSNT